MTTITKFIQKGIAAQKDVDEILQDFRTNICRGCGAKFVWLKTKLGAAIPVNVETVKPKDLVFEPHRHISHFATCPKAAEFRKKKPTKGVNKNYGHGK